MDATIVIQREYTIYIEKVFFEEVVPQVVANEKEFSVGVVNDVLNVVRVEVLENRYDNATIGHCSNVHSTPFGTVLANESYLIASQSSDKKLQIIKEYKTHFGAGCSKALSCQSVCPVKIETITSIMRMNRK